MPPCHGVASGSIPLRTAIQDQPKGKILVKQEGLTQATNAIFKCTYDQISNSLLLHLLCFGHFDFLWAILHSILERKMVAMKNNQREQSVLRLLEENKLTYREIAKEVGLKGPSTVYAYAKRLKRTRRHQINPNSCDLVERICKKLEKIYGMPDEANNCVWEAFREQNRLTMQQFNEWYETEFILKK